MMPIQDTLSRRTALQYAGRLAVAAPFLSLLGCDDAASTLSRKIISGTTMGTRYRITLAGRVGLQESGHLKALVERTLDRINRQMSTYRPDSELSIFNAARRTSWVSVSPDVAHVVSTALEVSERSGSAFDTTIAPLVDLWGFGPFGQQVRSETDGRIVPALRQTGHEHLRVRRAPALLRKTLPDLHVDLGGIAKGFAVDAVAGLLIDAGQEDFLVDLGGDMRAHRSSPTTSPWKIGIESPVVGRRALHRVVNIGQGSVATSGDYRKFFELQGSRYSHIIDPRTGAPVRHGLASVTVIAAGTEQADAWSTALMVLGPDAGLELAERLGIAAFFISRNEKGLADHPSSEFRRYLVS